MTSLWGLSLDISYIHTMRGWSVRGEIRRLLHGRLRNAQAHLAACEHGNPAANVFGLHRVERAVEADERFARVDLLERHHRVLLAAGDLLHLIHAHDRLGVAEHLDANALADRLAQLRVTGKEDVCKSQLRSEV